MPNNFLNAKYNECKRFFFVCNKNFDKNLNQLIWKISPKSVSSGTAVLVEIAANVAARTFNGSSSHEWARAVDRLRISRADQQAAKESK